MKGRHARGIRQEIKAGMNPSPKKVGPMAAMVINTTVKIRNSFSDIVSTSRIILMYWPFERLAVRQRVFSLSGDNITLPEFFVKRVNLMGSSDFLMMPISARRTFRYTLERPRPQGRQYSCSDNSQPAACCREDLLA